MGKFILPDSLVSVYLSCLFKGDVTVLVIFLSQAICIIPYRLLSFDYPSKKSINPPSYNNKILFTSHMGLFVFFCLGNRVIFLDMLIPHERLCLYPKPSSWGDAIFYRNATLAGALSVRSLNLLFFISLYTALSIVSGNFKSPVLTFCFVASSLE